jgi:hypothetical protein
MTYLRRIQARVAHHFALAHCPRAARTSPKHRRNIDYRGAHAVADEVVRAYTRALREAGLLRDQIEPPSTKRPRARDRVKGD